MIALACTALVTMGSAAARASTGAVEFPSGDLVGAPVFGGVQVAQVAQAELARGVREIPLGSNRAPRIALYRSAVVGAADGRAWCAYFVSWVARAAQLPLGERGRGLGSVAQLRRWAAAEGLLRRADPQVGDLVLWPEHVGVVVRRSAGQVSTVEGNSSDRVAARRYQVDQAALTVRIADLSR